MVLSNLKHYVGLVFSPVLYYQMNVGGMVSEIN